MIIGDHIRVLKGGRWLHGIDCGDRTVIYFSAGADNGEPGVQRARLSEFASGAGQVQIVNHAERVFPPRMVVARAFSRLRESAFSQMFFDSEQFAAWCKSGRLGFPLELSTVVGSTAKARAELAAKPKAAKAKPARAKARATSQSSRPAAKPRKAKQKSATKAAAQARSKAKLRPKAAKRAAPRKTGSKSLRAKPGAKRRR
jgi:hypothetical protein